MNHRHAAALALVGWYLIVAPKTKSMFGGEERYDDSAPFTKWTIERSLDKASTCEAIRDARQKKADEAVESWAKSADDPEARQATANAWMRKSGWITPAASRLAIPD